MTGFLSDFIIRLLICNLLAQNVNLSATIWTCSANLVWHNLMMDNFIWTSFSRHVLPFTLCLMPQYIHIIWKHVDFNLGCWVSLNMDFQNVHKSNESILLLKHLHNFSRCCLGFNFPSIGNIQKENFQDFSNLLLFSIFFICMYPCIRESLNQKQFTVISSCIRYKQDQQ